MLVSIINGGNNVTIAWAWFFLAVLMNWENFVKPIHIELPNKTCPLNRFEDSLYKDASVKKCLVYNYAFASITPSVKE